MSKALAALSLTAAIAALVAGCATEPTARETRPEVTPSTSQSEASDPVGSWGTEGPGGEASESAPSLTVYENKTFFASDGCFVAQGSWSEVGGAFDLALVESVTEKPDCPESWVGRADSMVPSEDSIVLLDEAGNELQTLGLISRDL